MKKTSRKCQFKLPLQIS